MDRFAFYHQNEALLLQFLLDECLSTYQKLLNKNGNPSIEEFVGLTPSLWQSHTGHFQKIDHYYSLYLTHYPERLSEDSNKAFETLCRSINRAMFPQIKREIKKFTRYFIDQLPAFKDQEQVLFFLLKRNQKLDAMYGKGFTAKTMGSLFLNGLEEAKKSLEEGYSQKGFNHVLPIIEKKITALR